MTSYRQDFFKVTKRLYTPSVSNHLDRSEFKDYDSKLSNALSRARSAVLEYALCNDWDFFCTFTFDERLVRDRFDLGGLVAVLMQWLQNMRKRYYPQLRYLLIPEQHKNGAWHFHGLISGIIASDLPGWAPRKLRKNGYLEWTDYRSRFGWCSLSPLRDPIAASFYAAKYITKSLAENSSFKGMHTHYQSRGLCRSSPLGTVGSFSSVFDSCLRSGNQFYSTGFFRCKDVGVGHIEDLKDMLDFVFTDPVSKQPLFLAGGDERFEELQMVLDSFRSPVSGLSHWDLPPESARRRSRSR